MAGHRLTQRIGALEQEAGGYAVLLVVERGETDEQAIARYEARHGPQPATVWQPIATGVPRGENAFCA